LGILTSIVTRIGIPLAIAVGAGLLIARFSEQIVGGISAGTSTIGQAISTPFGAFFTGLKEGFGNIPEFIDIKFPAFNFAFAQGQDPAGEAPNVPALSGSGFDLDQALTNLCRNSGGLICLGGAGSTGSGGGQTGGTGTQQTQLTPFGDPMRRTFFDIINLSQGSSRFLDLVRRDRTTLGELQEKGNIVGLFDFLGTSRTERVPLTLAQVGTFQDQIRLSAQLFKEFGSVKEIIAFG